MPENNRSLEFNKDTGRMELTDTVRPAIVETCDSFQPFSGTLWERKTTGYIRALTISGTKLTADLKLYDPLDVNKAPDKLEKVTGVVEKVTWNGSALEPLVFELLLTSSNWQKATGVEFKEDTGAEDDEEYEDAAIDFVVYSFDSVEQKFFKSFHSNEVALKGKFRFNGEDYDVQSFLTEEEQKRNPLVYRLHLSVIPPPGTAQTLFIGFGDSRTISRTWGDDSLEAKAKAIEDANARISRRLQQRMDAEKKEREEEEQAELAQQIEAGEEYASSIAQDEERKRLEELDKAREESELAELAARTAADEARTRAEAALERADERTRLEAEVALAEASKRVLEAEQESLGRLERADVAAVDREEERRLDEYDKRNHIKKKEEAGSKAKGLEPGLDTDEAVRAATEKVTEQKKELEAAARLEDGKRKAVLDRKKKAGKKEIEEEKKARAGEKKALEKLPPPPKPKSRKEKAEAQLAAEAKAKRHADALAARQSEREADKKLQDRNRPAPKKPKGGEEEDEEEVEQAKPKGKPAKNAPPPEEEADPFEMKALEHAEKAAAIREEIAKLDKRQELLDARLFELELERASEKAKDSRVAQEALSEAEEGREAIREEYEQRREEIKQSYEGRRAAFEVPTRQSDARLKSTKKALDAYLGIGADEPEEVEDEGPIGLAALGNLEGEEEEDPAPTVEQAAAKKLEAEAREALAKWGGEIAKAEDSAARAKLSADRAVREATESRRKLERQRKMIEALEADLARINAEGRDTVDTLSAHGFREMLSVKCKLTLDGEVKEIGGGSISYLQLALETWGFTGEMELLVTLDTTEDPLIAKFTGSGLIEIELAVKSAFQSRINPPDALKVQGIVTARSVIEDSYDALADAKVLRRRYRMSFADAASVLWKQHIPCELYADMALKDVVDLNKGGKITITGDWAGHWDGAKPIIFLGLGAPGEKATFYDFIVWYAARHQGYFVYDPKTNAYALLGAKLAGAKAVSLDPDDVDEMRIPLPVIPRHVVNVLNGCTEAATKTTAVANADAVTGLRHDPVTRLAVAKDYDAEKKIEDGAIKPRCAEVHIDFGRFPTVTFATGSIVDWKKEGWAKEIYPKAKTYRVRSYRIEARGAASPDATNAGGGFGDFDVTASAVLEEKADPAAHLPPHRVPRYPVYVEGKVVAVGGEDLDRMWLVVDDKKTSISYYKVEVPLWNKKIPALFYPGPYHGHFYFPAYKHERVLLRMGLFDAEIARFIDWAPKGRVPADTQGNHLLLGKADKNETSITHLYVDAKPELTIFRDMGGDTQTLTLLEGALKMVVEAEEATGDTTPKFDVTMQVESAKGDLQMQGGGAVSGVSGELAGALAGPTGALTGAQGEVEGELGATESELGGDADAVKGELEGKLAGLGKGSEALDAALASAIADIDKAMA